MNVKEVRYNNFLSRSFTNIKYRVITSIKLIKNRSRKWIELKKSKILYLFLTYSDKRMSREDNRIHVIILSVV